MVFLIKENQKNFYTLSALLNNEADIKKFFPKINIELIKTNFKYEYLRDLGVSILALYAFLEKNPPNLYKKVEESTSTMTNKQRVLTYKILEDITRHIEGSSLLTGSLTEFKKKLEKASNKVEKQEQQIV